MSVKTWQRVNTDGRRRGLGERTGLLHVAVQGWNRNGRLGGRPMGIMMYYP